MTHDRDLDRMLARWMDDGPTAVTDRVVVAALTDVHTTRQRGARWATLKELFMTMKPAVMIGAIAIVAVLGITAYRAFLGGETDIGGPSTRMLTADDLPQIVLSASEAPAGMGHDRTVDDPDEVLLRPIVDRSSGANVQRALSQPGFVAGLYSEFSNPTSGVLSWAALFDTVEHAVSAVALYDEEVRSETGHALIVVTDAGLGDEGSHYTDAEGVTHVYLWRVGTLVTAVANFGDVDPEELRSIAETVDARAD